MFDRKIGVHNNALQSLNTISDLVLLFLVISAAAGKLWLGLCQDRQHEDSESRDELRTGAFLYIGMPGYSALWLFARLVTICSRSRTLVQVQKNLSHRNQALVSLATPCHSDDANAIHCHAPSPSSTGCSEC